jgi:hypothetical protein
MPDTLDYMLMGYAFGLGIVLFLAASLWWRFRNLQADEQALAELEQKVTKEKKPGA